MKKVLNFVMSAAMVLGFSANAFAIHADIPSETSAAVAKGTTQITLGGEMRVRGWYVDNISGARRAASTPADTSSQGWYDQRVRLSLQADVSKNTTAFVQLESFGGTTTDNITWGVPMTLNSRHTETLNFLEAWVLHKGSGLFGIPAGIKIGHMPLALGERQFLDHTKFGDDAIVVFFDPTKELHLGLVTTKFSEGTTAADSAADINGYVALATYKWDKDNTAGINYTYVQAPNNGIVVGTAGQKFSFQNLGIHANGSIAGLTYNAEFDQQFGNASDNLKFKGYGLFAGIGYKIDPVNIRAQFAMGSGDSDATDNKIKEFQVTSGNDIHSTFIYEYTTRTAATSGQPLNNVAGGRSTGIANTTYYRLGLDFAPMKDLTTSIDGFILRATKAAAGSKSIGTEFDVKLAYKLDRNFTYFVTAGYFDGGKWWEDNAGVASSQNKAITQAVHGITLSF